MIVIGMILLWFVVGRNTTDYDAIARTQSTAMTIEIVEDTNGADTLLGIVRNYPEDARDENVRQLVDFWFSSQKPILYPTEGEDADWFERDAARRMVKRRMVKYILEEAGKLP